MAVAAEIILTADEKKRLGKSTGSRKAAVRLQARSRIVLLASEDMTNGAIVAGLDIGKNKVGRWCN